MRQSKAAEVSVGGYAMGRRLLEWDRRRGDRCLKQQQRLHHIVSLLLQVCHFDHAPENLRLPPPTMVVARIPLLIEMRFGAAEYFSSSSMVLLQISQSQICALVHPVSNHNIDRGHQFSYQGLGTPVPCICICDYIHLPLVLARVAACPPLDDEQGTFFNMRSLI
ncbi:unnamed protein product [Linum tenue]|uniref:Uncharacterized protein n=1 Tax=Linum tenue TaxID=586396 RepID=A0AAV0LC02_9ROSI|nr:unnamed protein product [Linum tenue]